MQYVRVVSTGGCEGGPSLILFFHERRYLINCGEGTQRHCIERQIKVPKINVIFCTSMHWECIGGIPGLLLTYSDAGGKNITLAGLNQMESFLQATRFFVHSGPHTTNTLDLERNIYDDGCIKVFPILSIGSPADREKEDHQQKCHSDICLSFAVHFPDTPGKFDPIAAKALGVPAGPLFSRLKLGQSVTLPDGTEIQSNQCVGPLIPGKIILILHCLSFNQCLSLSTNGIFKEYQLEGKYNPDIVAIYHFSNAEILNNEHYLKLVDSISRNSQIKHVLMGNQARRATALPSSILMQKALHSLAPDFFSSLSWMKQDFYQAPSEQVFPKDFTVRAIPNLQLNVRPEVEFVQAEQKTPQSSAHLKRLVESSGVNLAHAPLAEEKPSVNDPMQLESAVINEPKPSTSISTTTDQSEIVCLGTGAAIPSKYRNVSAIFIHDKSDPTRKGYLLDCGEGTLGQIKLCFGDEGAKEIVLNMHCILISHIHADHHLGLVRILLQRQSYGCQEELHVLGPNSLHRWLQEYSKICPLKYKFTDCQSLLLAPILLNGSRVEVKAFPVIHCQSSYGFLLKLSQSYSIVYSGDTRPCDALVAVGTDCDLLIHEATFETELQQEAIAKKHSTTQEAIEISRKMNAKFTLLTHFSQRYPKIPKFEENHDEGIIGVAFDFMRTKLDLQSLSSLRKYIPQLESIFPEEIKIGKEEIKRAPEELQPKSTKKIKK